MPVYEYQCAACDSVFEALQPMDSKTAPCPKCAETGIPELGDRILSATPTTFRHNDKKTIKNKGH